MGLWTGNVHGRGDLRMFMVDGPFGPFTSQPLVHEYQVNWFTCVIKYMLDHGLKSAEVAPAVEAAWVEECERIAALTLFSKTDSWINGANIPGKPKRTMVYMGGMMEYAKRAAAVADHLDRHFTFT